MNRKIIALLLPLAGLAFAGSAKEKQAKVSNDTTVCYEVSPVMVCQNCENKIKSNLRFEKGVKHIEASAKEGVVKVTYDKRKTSAEGLKEGFRKIGYEAKEKAITGPAVSGRG